MEKRAARECMEMVVALARNRVGVVRSRSMELMGHLVVHRSLDCGAGWSGNGKNLAGIQNEPSRREMSTAVLMGNLECVRYSPSERNFYKRRKRRNDQRKRD